MHFRLGKTASPKYSGGVIFKRGRLVKSPLLNRFFPSFLAETRKGAPGGPDVPSVSIRYEECSISLCELKPLGIVPFLKIQAAQKGFSYPDFFHRSLWKLITFAVDKYCVKFSPHALCKSFGFPHTALWKKNRCGCRRNRTYPHKFPLLRLLLPIILSVYIYSERNTSKEFAYAIYL